jgi:hypothetical protein
MMWFKTMSVSASNFFGSMKVLSFFYMTYLIFYVKLALDLAAALYVGFFLSYMISSLVMRMVFRSTFVEKNLNLAEMIFCVPFLFGVYWWLPYLCITNVDTPILSAPFYQQYFLTWAL